MRADNDHPRYRKGRPLARLAIALWLFSALAHAADCCCGPEASFWPQGHGGVTPGTHEDGHSLAHDAPHGADAGTAHAHDESTGPETDPGCSEVKQPDANFQSNWAAYVGPGGPDQPGLGRLELSLPRAPVLASAIRPAGVRPPSLNPFLSTIRLLL